MAVFGGPKLKIKRADKHIRDFDALINEFLRTDFYRVITEKNPGAGTVTFRYEAQPVPEDAPLIIGDAVHNLRAALDLMYVEIIDRNGGTPTKRDSFPFMQKRHKLIEALNGGEIKRAGQSIIDLIVDSVRPYREAGGNDALCSLHDMDITDKHHLIVSVVGAIGATSFSYFKEVANTITQLGSTMNVSSVTFMDLSNAKYHIEEHEKPAFHVLFGEGHFKGKPVVKTLHELSQLVSGIVQTFEKHIV